MKNLAKIGLGLGLLATQASVIFAAAPGEIVIGQPEQVKIVQLGTLISAIVGIAIIGAALMAFVYLVWGGIQWIGSGGDKAGMEQARNRITAAFIGLFIVAAAWAITKLIENFFGIKILEGFTIPKGY